MYTVYVSVDTITRIHKLYHSPTHMYPLQHHPMGCRYIENLDLSQTEVDEAVRKSTNYLLSKTLSGTMSDVIRSSQLTLQQLSQISVNTSCLQFACKVRDVMRVMDGEPLT